MTEEDFLANIATRLRRPTPTHAPNRDAMGAPDFWQERQVGSLVDLFTAELEKLGGEVTAVDSLVELHAKLAELLVSWSGLRIGTWGGSFTSDFHLDNLLAPYDVLPWDAPHAPLFDQVDVSLTGAAYAVADTGTIVLLNGGDRGRSVAVLPTIHIVLLHEGQIRRQLGDVLLELGELKGNAPASIHFISGPSRSSDIENDQTIGIHGPAAVRVFIIRSPGA